MELRDTSSSEPDSTRSLWASSSSNSFSRSEGDSTSFSSFSMVLGGSGFEGFLDSDFFGFSVEVLDLDFTSVEEGLASVNIVYI